LSEVVVSLWFEDVGFLNESMLDTPVGRFSIRQMVVFLVFGLLAWGVSLVFVDLVFKIVAACAVFVSGAAFFARKVKTVSPEAHLLCLFKRFLQVVAQKKFSSTTLNSKLFVEPSSEVMVLSAVLGVPVKVVGVLKDFSGKLLCGKSFKVSVNGIAHSSGLSDTEGCFCTYFISDRTGRFEVAIQPEDHPGTIQKITIQVNSSPKTPENGKEVEVTQNA
jgi:hypothetical protein